MADWIQFQVAIEGLPTNTFGRLSHDQIAVAATRSRSVLGSMNEFAFLSGAFIEDQGGLGTADIARLNHELNRTPMRALGMLVPIEAATALLSG